MLDAELLLGDRTVGKDAPPYVIAEIGSNHDQSMDTARSLIDASAAAGADAVKFQLFRADALYPGGGEMHDLFSSIQLDPSWVPELAAHSAGAGVHFLASAFDVQSLEVIDAAGVVAHKVASSETADLSFIAAVAATGRPILLSTGMCDLVDVAAAVDVCIGLGNAAVALLQCGAVYPLHERDANLRVLTTFQRTFGGVVGFSDHTEGLAAAAAAVALGARVFEKHVTHDRTADGPDHSYAVEPETLAAYVRTIRDAHVALGSSEKRMLDQEREVGRRDGLWLVDAVAAGDPVAGAIEVRRPAIGIRARQAPAIARAVARRDLKAGQPLRWEDVTP